MSHSVLRFQTLLVGMHVTGFKVKIIKHKGTVMGRMWASPPGVWTPERQEVDEISFLVLPLPHHLLVGSFRPLQITQMV